MWYKYLIVTIGVQDIKIGMKYDDIKNICIIGGQKRFSEIMFSIVNDFFLIDRNEIMSSFPQTYKIRLSFRCNREIIEAAKISFRGQSKFQIIEVAHLDRTMR